MIAQEFSRGGTRAGRHTLPECHSHVGIVASHGSENQSHTVGFSLVVARVLQVAELQSVLCHHLSYRLCVLSHAQGASDGASNLQAILLLDLLRHLFGRVGCHCVCDFVSKHDGQRSLILRDGQQSLVDNNLSARHTECVHVLILHQIELPLIVLNLVGIAIVHQIGLHGIGQLLTYALYHSGVRCVGRLLCRLHVLRILRSAERQHFRVADHQALLASRQGYGARGATCREQHSCHHSNHIMFEILHCCVIFVVRLIIRKVK